ncbi:MAG: hypothetical protein IIA35_08180 [Proteobacteria bacterium]|nr:hypothetical protein [Pseudomonadota bacterium]
MKWQGSPRALGLVVGVSLALALLPSLSGCSAGQSTLNRFFEAFGRDETPLPPEALKQLERFKTVYKVYSADPDEKDRLDYFDFAYRQIRVSYVQEISDATLIDAAIKGGNRRLPLSEVHLEAPVPNPSKLPCYKNMSLLNRL